MQQEICRIFHDLSIPKPATTISLTHANFAEKIIRTFSRHLQKHAVVRKHVFYTKKIVHLKFILCDDYKTKTKRQITKGKIPSHVIHIQSVACMYLHFNFFISHKY